MKTTRFENQPIIVASVLEAIKADWLISNERGMQAFRVFIPSLFLSFAYSDSEYCRSTATYKVQTQMSSACSHSQRVLSRNSHRVHHVTHVCIQTNEEMIIIIIVIALMTECLCEVMIKHAHGQ